ncbi:trypco2 family protein [Streptomyces sp. NPDC058086]|uniref:trypco2 family protein n=1 Tax=Streptomyces sp. NPDC058086 TaxID=3346334 RepID=UPI0036E6A6F3
MLFALGEITLELGLELTGTKGVDGGLRWSVISLTGKKESGTRATHTVTVKLAPHLPGGGDLDVSDVEKNRRRRAARSRDQAAGVAGPSRPERAQRRAVAGGRGRDAGPTAGRPRSTGWRHAGSGWRRAAWAPGTGMGCRRASGLRTRISTVGRGGWTGRFCRTTTPAGSAGPQSTTVSHHGEDADRSGARVPRCTPTGLSHVAGAVDQSKPRRPDRNDSAGALSLGSLGLLGAVAALTCGGVAWEPRSHPGPVPAVPRGSPRDLARHWHGSFVEQPVRRLDLGTLEPQLMTVSHAGGCADGSGARVPGHPTATKKLGNGGIEYTRAATAAPSWGWTIRPRLRHPAKGCRLSRRQASSPRPIFPAGACAVSIESCLDEETRAVHRAGCAVP